MKIENYIGQVVRKIGLPALLEQLAEEAAELAQASLKLSRVIRAENPTPVTLREAWDNLAEEIGDVNLCVEALRSEMPSETETIGNVMMRKQKRWFQRLGIDGED